jgi:hypothetical protein
VRRAETRSVTARTPAPAKAVSYSDWTFGPIIRLWARGHAYSLLDMTLKKVAFWVLVVFLVAFVIKSPVAAAKVVRVTGEASGQWLSTAFDALTKFIRSLT